MRYVLPQIEHLPLWPKIAVPFFFSLFVGIIWWTYKKSRREIYEATAQLPLVEDTESAQPHVEEEK